MVRIDEMVVAEEPSGIVICLSTADVSGSREQAREVFRAVDGYSTVCADCTNNPNSYYYHLQPHYQRQLVLEK